MKKLKLDDRYFPLVLDAVDYGIFTVDPNGKITSFNKGAEVITCYSADEVIGRQCSEVFRTNRCNTVCPLRRSIASRSKIENRAVKILSKDGRPIPISISTAPLETPIGELLGGVEIFRDRSHVEALQRKLDDKYRFEDILSKSPRMHQIFYILPMVAESTSTILITGASGTGKELLAKAIHNHGPRKKKAFVAINCAALPETLLESELFGYKKGAFTDARKDKSGRVAQAEGGTLFLDEVGDLPMTLQVKLLRFLQEKTFEPLGSSEPINADVRVITATHRNLESMVERGEFRKDLFFRLNVLQIDLPSLRNRTEDIPLLAQHFIQRFRKATGKAIEGLTSEAMAALLKHDFPGNIRELENLIERAFILCEDSVIGIESLPQSVSGVTLAQAPTPHESLGGLERIEADAIRTALARHGGNRTRAAKDLGIHRTTLIRKLKHYGLENLR